MGSQFCEYILQIIINPETVGFGGLHQIVHDGTGLGTTDGIHIDPVLTADSERADGTLSRVVVHGNITVIQKDPEVRFLIQPVLQAFDDGDKDMLAHSVKLFTGIYSDTLLGVGDLRGEIEWCELVGVI